MKNKDKTNTIKDLENMSPDKLGLKLIELKKELATLSLGRLSKKIKNTQQFRQKRKDIARVMTIIRKKETDKNI